MCRSSTFLCSRSLSCFNSATVRGVGLEAFAVTGAPGNKLVGAIIRASGQPPPGGGISPPCIGTPAGCSSFFGSPGRAGKKSAHSLLAGGAPRSPRVIVRGPGGAGGASNGPAEGGYCPGRGVGRGTASRGSRGATAPASSPPPIMPLEPASLVSGRPLAPAGRAGRLVSDRVIGRRLAIRPPVGAIAPCSSGASCGLTPSGSGPRSRSAPV